MMLLGIPLKTLNQDLPLASHTYRREVQDAVITIEVTMATWIELITVLPPELAEKLVIVGE